MFLTIVFTSIIVAVQAATRLPINSTVCENFLQKFGQQNVESTKLRMFGEVKIENGSVNVIFRYDDQQFFNNSTYFGFVVEDGQTPENTCLDLRIHKYSNEQFTNPEEVTGLNITGSKNQATYQRFYILNFKINELQQRMIETTAANHFLYSGYYALSFYLQGTEQPQFIHRFMFQIRVNRKTETISESSFNSISDESVLSCSTDPTCTVSVVSDLWFCLTNECKEFSATPPQNIYLNDIFFMFQNTTSPNLVNYTYSDSKIYFLASGLLKSATILSANYSAGNATYELQANIAWDKLKIQATTTLTSPSGRRILTDISNLVASNNVTDSVYATSTETCFKVNSSNSCPECLDICKINNSDAPGVCECSGLIQKLLLLILLVIL